LIELANEWAASFYQDKSLDVANVEIRSDSLRFWLVRFEKPKTDEGFYAAVSDRTVVESQEDERV